MPKISVAVACYNSANFIRETLESVLSQTYGDFEVIVVDDGSKDQTGEIVRSFSDPRIKYFYKANEGLSATRNKAISLAKGEHIAFLDHDDLWLPQKLEKQLAMLESNKDLGLVFTDSYILRDGIRERATYFKRFPPKRGDIFEDLLFTMLNYIVMSAAIVPKNIFYEIGFFNTDLKMVEDIELFLRIAERYQCDYVDQPLVAYRLHDGNFSKSNKEILFDEALHILESWQLRKPDLFLKEKDRFLKKNAALLAGLAHFYALSNNKKDALTNFDLSLSKSRDFKALLKKYILMLFGCPTYRTLCRMRNA